MKQFIVTTGLQAATITNSPDALLERDNLLYAASHQVSVANASDAESAARVLKEIKKFTRTIEDARVEVKAPIIDLGKKVDDHAKDLTAKLNAEATRIGNELAAWQLEQNRIAEQLKREAWEKEQALKREAQEREQAAAREAQRIADEAAAAARKEQEELAAKAARARTEEGRQKALAEAEKARVAAEARAEQARKEAEEQAQQRHEATVVAVVETRVAVAAAAPAKQAGVATSRVPKFEVTDIAKLYEACPFMVKLTPNDAVILSAIKGLTPDQHIPGIKHWFEVKSIVR